MKGQDNGPLMVSKIINVTGAGFRIRALETFAYQYENNAIYRAYCEALGRTRENVMELVDIPFLPISFFKTHDVLTAPAVKATCPQVFESSGTTGFETSRHYVYSEALYEASLLQGFREFYGEPSAYAILALLPSYLERPNASLVYMARVLMAAGGNPRNGFFTSDFERLGEIIKELEGVGQKILLLGVTFALLDFAEVFRLPLQHTIVMETGGMKGRRKEMTRDEVHEALQAAWTLDTIHAEYGMTEMLSQAYSNGGGVFRPASTMQVLARDINDPLDTQLAGSGALNVIDLSNYYSCSFIATEDIGVVAVDGTFSVLGRMDHTVLRGCSMLVV